ncbi:hypothetical protein An08g03370 [Aspergillus niger]|uniref:Uncharacterized protein n=2 Tax=Aspergillus niger TaxID=5061 RepID=A2QQQ7_ASPNC|nr:hypothetical protein An08g03370 [Aspergillus niger]CAK45373.1 hypothetical protein An08g03370 [Aspergillus niger]
MVYYCYRQLTITSIRASPSLVIKLTPRRHAKGPTGYWQVHNLASADLDIW